MTLSLLYSFDFFFRPKFPNLTPGKAGPGGTTMQRGVADSLEHPEGRAAEPDQVRGKQMFTPGLLTTEVSHVVSHFSPKK